MRYTLTRKVNNAPTSSHSSTACGVCSTSTQKHQATTAAVVRQPCASDDGTATRDNKQIEGSDGEDEQESQGGIQPRSRARKFRNMDLPGLPGMMLMWRDVFLPHWFQYLATNENVWQIDHPDHLAIAQKIWNRKMPIHQTLALQDEPVFYLVIFLLLWYTITNIVFIATAAHL